MTSAGQLNRVMRFQKKGDGNDGFGVIPGAGPWETIFSAHCRFVVRTGDEIVLNSVATGVRTVEITTRDYSGSRAVNTTWRVLDASDNIYAVKLVKPDEKNAFITFVAEMGG
ncbi:head-tail adaptor protein [Agrobacterium tumefaciens]|nr:head-tail adaptor protein [Agrobacterium tumefaciens]